MLDLWIDILKPSSVRVSLSETTKFRAIYVEMRKLFWNTMSHHLNVCLLQTLADPDLLTPKVLRTAVRKVIQEKGKKRKDTELET